MLHLNIFHFKQTTPATSTPTQRTNRTSSHSPEPQVTTPSPIEINHDIHQSTPSTSLPPHSNSNEANIQRTPSISHINNQNMLNELNQIEQEIQNQKLSPKQQTSNSLPKQQTSNSTTAKHTYQGKRMTMKRGLKSKSTSNTKSKLTNKTPKTKNSRTREIHDILKGAEEFLIIISDESESEEKVTPAAQSQSTEPHTSPVDTAVQSGPFKRPSSPTPPSSPSTPYFISKDSN